MDYFYLLLVGGSVLVYLILLFDKLQRRRVDAILKSTHNVQPLLMMQSLGQKLNKINTALAATEGTAKHEIELQLQQITFDYNNGHIDMQVYDNKLSQLLTEAGIR